MARGTAWPVPRSGPSNGSANWGVGDSTSGAAAGPRRGSKSSEIGTTVKFQANPNGQRLTIARIDTKRVRFELKAGGTANRSISGIAYVIYDGDVEIESEEGIGYAADQFFFWEDGLGKRGVSIRLFLCSSRTVRACWNGGPVRSSAKGSCVKLIRRAGNTPIVTLDACRCPTARCSGRRLRAAAERVIVSRTRDMGHCLKLLACASLLGVLLSPQGARGASTDVAPIDGQQANTLEMIKGSIAFDAT